ncbi:hypothetical protein N7495_008919 [Penicillium taxi]|uniref:uncharacterized protein n=1 Tax=Penicillium taxi TaxID=168475 RepID=UPI00254581CB|nr:uncharacterized protein N7495_008919 [Penicillium taxi]KAJ5888878.1 hypothetical protein N7495_008919 [Penicillium taxi]
MGKRKKSSRTPQGPRKREPLATTFSCLFCNHENAVIIKLDRKLGFGKLFCKVCGQEFETAVNYLSAEVDVYSDWVDACDTVHKQNEDDRAVSSQPGNSKRDISLEPGQEDNVDDEY